MDQVTYGPLDNYCCYYLYIDTGVSHLLLCLHVLPPGVLFCYYVYHPLYTSRAQTAGQCTGAPESFFFFFLVLYGLCGSGNSRRSVRRATDVKNGNAGPKLHWSLWEKSVFPALTRDPFLLVNNNGHNGDAWA